MRSPQAAFISASGLDLPRDGQWDFVPLRSSDWVNTFVSSRVYSRERRSNGQQKGVPTRSAFSTLNLSSVRWRTSRSRPRCSSTAACWSAVLTGTKQHRRAPNRLADRFGIGGIVLVALDVRLHVLRRHQSHLVAKRAQLPPPVVRR